MNKAAIVLGMVLIVLAAGYGIGGLFAGYEYERTVGSHIENAYVDNIREFLKENGRADWIAESAYYVNKNVLYYPIVQVVIGIVLIFCILASILASFVYPTRTLLV